MASKNSKRSRRVELATITITALSLLAFLIPITFRINVSVEYLVIASIVLFITPILGVRSKD